MIQDTAWNEEKHVTVYDVRSEFLGGANPVEVLLPDDFDTTQAYRVLYVLPVENGIGGRFGDGLQAVRATHAHNHHGLICVQPSFDTVSWFGSHAYDPRIRHERYIKETLVPLIESRYPVIGGTEGRLLFGFSKSGWGAFTLLLRDPTFFGYACAWDAPLMLKAWMPAWEMARHYGTVEHYERYRPVRLFETQAAHFRDRTRFVLLGSQNFGSHPEDQFAGLSQTQLAHTMLTRFRIQHAFDDSLTMDHCWDSGWVAPAIEALMAVAKDTD